MPPLPRKSFEVCYKLVQRIDDHSQIGIPLRQRARARRVVMVLLSRLAI
jgi:hypothetical protein